MMTSRNLTRGVNSGALAVRAHEGERDRSPPSGRILPKRASYLYHRGRLLGASRSGGEPCLPLGLVLGQL